MDEIVFSDQLVSDLLDAQPQPVFWMRPVWNENKSGIVDFEYSYCNEEMCRFFGVPKEKLIGVRLSASIMLSEEWKKKALNQLVNVYTTGKKLQDNIYNVKFDKHYSYLRTKVSEGILTVIQDRTSEYSMIHELEQQKTLLNNILQQTPNGITVNKVFRNKEGELKDQVVILANEAAIRYLGRSREELLVKTACELEPNYLHTPLFKLTELTLKTGKPFRVEHQSDYTKKWLEISVSKMDEEHLIHVFTDITESKNAQLHIEKAAQTLHTVVNATLAGMFTLHPVFDERGTITDFRFGMVNEAIAAYIGQTAKRLAGALGSTWFPAYKSNGLFDIYADTYVSSTPHQFDFHYEEGYDLFFSIQTAKMDDAVLVTFTDQTALKRTQRELEGKIEALRQSNANLEEFAYAASHDLKEPIRKIHFFADRLKNKLLPRLDEGETHMFERMELAAKRMTLLVDDLLAYSHVSLRSSLFEEINLNQKLQVVLNDLELEIMERQAIITVNHLPTIMGHRRQMQQLFQNLISNALKYSKPGTRPQITITAHEVYGYDTGLPLPADAINQPYHLIEVTDSGIGFEQKDADRIFNVFQRLHGNSEYRVSGVGLAIVRKVVENHQGFITAMGALNKGATFSIYLPAQFKPE